MSTWADLFRLSFMEAKKMIVFKLIKQVRVSREYKLEIDLHVGYEQFAGFLQTASYDHLLEQRIAL